MNLRKHSLLAAALVLFLTSCAARAPLSSEPSGSLALGVKGYVDIQSGWRIRAVTPVTKSGVHKVVTKPDAVNGNAVSVKTSDDLIGYETAYYSVQTRSDGGMVISFKSATVTKQGKSAKQTRPLVPLFNLPDDIRFVRLLFFTRVSSADHDQGIVAARSMQQLEAITDTMQADPAHNCIQDAQMFCSWVPDGVAVQPEKRDGSGKWIPAT